MNILKQINLINGSRQVFAVWTSVQRTAERHTGRSANGKTLEKAFDVAVPMAYTERAQFK